VVAGGLERILEKQVSIVGLGGSLSEHSTSLAALRLALKAAEMDGAKTTTFDVKSLELPMYSPQMTVPPPAAVQLAEASYEAQGLIWSSPLYHGTVSGAFKNALDWLQLLSGREPAFLTNKVVGLMSTAGGVQGLQAVNTMEFVVRALRGWAVPLVLPIPQAARFFDEAGSVLDPQIGQQLSALGREVARAARQFAFEGHCDYADQATPVQGS